MPVLTPRFAYPCFASPSHPARRLALSVLVISMLGMSGAYAASPCPPDWEPEICELKDVVETIKRDSFEPVDVHKMLNDGIKRTVGTLTHGQFMDQGEYADMWKNFRDGGYAGIGVVVSLEEGRLRVMSVVENGPAEKAGVHPNDLITEVDGVGLKGNTFKQSTDHILGKPNTDVMLTIQRAGHKSALHITIRRAFVQTAQIKYAMVAPHIGWVRIPSFDEGAAGKTVEALKALDQQDPHLKGLIVDFRNNGGGSLSAAVGVISIFLEGKQPAVQIKGHDAANSRTLYTELNDYKTEKDVKDNIVHDPLDGLPAQFKTVPMAILIHQNSASAPELVSGTLQDYGRATLLGKVSYGKGSVQTISERLNKTGLRLTTAHYFTAKGCAVNGYGVTPDYLVDEHASGDADDVWNFHEVDIPKADYEGVSSVVDDKAVDKAPDSTAPVTQAPSSQTPGTQTSVTASDVKAPDAKADVKSPDSKASDTKSSDIKAADAQDSSQHDPLAEIRKARIKKRTELAIALDKQHQTLPDPVLPKVYGTDQDDMLKQAVRYLQGQPVYQKRGVLSQKQPHDLAKCSVGQ